MLHRYSALMLFVAVFGCRAEKPPAAQVTPETRTVEPSAPATLLDVGVDVGASPSSDTQKAWDALRFEAVPVSASSVTPSSTADVPAPPVAEPPPTTLSSMDALWERARSLEPQLQAIAQEADTLEAARTSSDA
jgi:hypothetical protein